MATSALSLRRRYPSKQFLAGDFVISAGCVLFRPVPQTSPFASDKHQSLEICVLRMIGTDEWVLPKGRKERGETIEAAALRETYEETGFKCQFWPQRMKTRAPVPGVESEDAVAVADGLAEPITVSIREQGEMGVKLVFWFVGTVVDSGETAEGGPPRIGFEKFEPVFVPAGEAEEKLTFASDREVVKEALDIVLQH